MLHNFSNMNTHDAFGLTSSYLAKSNQYTFSLIWRCTSYISARKQEYGVILYMVGVILIHKSVVIEQTLANGSPK